MLRYRVKSRVAHIGKRKGQTLYFGVQMKQNKTTLPMLVDIIVNKTSLAKGDVHNAIISLADEVNNALLRGELVDLGELGSFRLVADSRCTDSPEELTHEAIQTPHIEYRPKRAMLKSVKRVPIRIIK